MAVKPTILGYGRTHGLSIHLSEDRSSLDVVIQPYKADLPFEQPLGLVFMGIGLLAPLAGAFWYWQRKGDLAPLVLGFFIEVLLFPAMLWLIAATSKWEIRIRANRQGLSLDREFHDSSISRAWEREEIRGLRVERQPWNKGRKWAVLLHLSMVDPVLADRLNEEDANALSDALRSVMDLPVGIVAQNAPPISAPAPIVPPMLDCGSVPSRHGVLVERTPARLTIIVPERGRFLRIKSGQPEAIIELDRQSLSVDYIDRSREDPSRRIQQSWLREEIMNVKGDLYGMGLTIRVAGKDMLELLHRHPQELRVWIARTLDEELRQAWDKPAKSDEYGGVV